MSTSLKLVALVGFACLLGVVTALDHTHVYNRLDVPVTASIDYDVGGSSQFQDRVIQPGAEDVDEYNPLPVGSIHVTVTGPDGCESKVGIDSDESVTVQKKTGSDGQTIQGFYLHGNSGADSSTGC